MMSGYFRSLPICTRVSFAVLSFCGVTTAGAYNKRRLRRNGCGNYENKDCIFKPVLGLQPWLCEEHEWACLISFTARQHGEYSSSLCTPTLRCPSQGESIPAQRCSYGTIITRTMIEPSCPVKIDSPLRVDWKSDHPGSGPHKQGTASRMLLVFRDVDNKLVAKLPGQVRTSHFEFHNGLNLGQEEIHSRCTTSITRHRLFPTDIIEIDHK